jgi:glycosyltransferase involved in cell wall biosynthesis/GT2 family glycosyltransferase
MARLASLAAVQRQETVRKTHAMTTIDVIVPVCHDASAVRRCLASLLAAKQATPFEIVVVSDGSSESELARWLRDLALQRQIVLLDLPERQGLAATLNRGVALHRDLGRDIVILRSDTEVAGDWLDRLAAHASANDVGTIVPFVNTGGVIGYPRSPDGNTLPVGQSVVAMDRLFCRANAGAAVTIPLSCGPCVYVRRECLNAVGVFESPLDGGEAWVQEDFSLRAAKAGFRNLLAADVYVWCQGDAADARGFATLADDVQDERDAHCGAARRDLLQRDPGRPYQRRVDLLRLAESPRQLLLFVAHAWGGGVRRHMDELAALIAERCDVLLLEPAVDDTVKLSWLRPGEAFAAYFSLPHELPALVALLGELELARIHFHHVHGLPRAVLDLPRALGLPFDCTLHDYYPICPQYHLVNEQGRYCGEPDADGCAECLRRRPGQWGLDIARWRVEFGTLLREADRVFAPSRDVAERVARYFPDIGMTVLPHAQENVVVPRVVRVVILGRLSPEKGLHVLSACAADARARGLPLSFRVLGATTEPVPQWPDAAVSVHGEYADSDLAALIAAERPDAIWFPSQVPETYSYTLSTALDAGAPIVASALGALPERLAEYPRGMLMAADASPGEWNDALLQAGGMVSAVRGLSARVAVS